MGKQAVGAIIDAWAGRRVRVRGVGLCTILEWSPLGACLCDLKVQPDTTDHPAWVGSADAADDRTGERMPSRRGLIQAREAENDAQLAAIAARWSAEGVIDG